MVWLEVLRLVLAIPNSLAMGAGCIPRQNWKGQFRSWCCFCRRKRDRNSQMGSHQGKSRSRLLVIEHWTYWYSLVVLIWNSVISREPCKCPQARESEVELIDFVDWFCLCFVFDWFCYVLFCHASALTSQVLIIISHVIKFFCNTSKGNPENRVSTFLKKERRASIYWNSRSRQ